MLELEPTGFTSTLDVGCKRKRLVKDDSRVCGLNSWTNKEPLTKMRKSQRS